MKAKGIFHLHLVVSDMQRSVDFYTKVFGMVDTGFRDRDEPDLVFLVTPGSGDLLTLNPAVALQDRVGVNAGVEHFGIKLDDMDYDAWVCEVEKHGGSVVSRGTFPHGLPFLYIADPDGYHIELQGPDAKLSEYQPPSKA
ncbi:MAG: lactoylglutathione lyase [Acidimicrobiales bacterium]